MFRGWKLPLYRTRDHGLRHRFRARLRLEELEPRTLLSVFTPVQIRHAYGIDQISLNGPSGAVTGDGSGQTIAIVDAYFAPTIQSDLATFSTQYGLPQLDGAGGNGTFTQLDLSGGTLSPPGDDWTLETALDVEWAHAVAPKANILLVEAASDTQDPVTSEPTDLLNAVQTAATTPGVVAVSMSWGITEVPGETAWDSFFTTPGVTFVAASGDSGAGTIWPSTSPNVLSVGGTTLRLTASNTISSERGWGYGALSPFFGGSGGGFSQFEPLPSYQQNIPTVINGFRLTDFGVRLNPDVAYDAAPNTGVAVLDTADGGWFAVGGTSAGAPQWAALTAIADQGRALNSLPSLSSTDTLNALYGLQGTTPGDFRDITQGNTGTYEIVDGSGNPIGTLPVQAVTGYDMVTGLGTPVANNLVPDLAQAATSTAGKAAKSLAAASGAQSGGSSGSSAGNHSKQKDVPGSPTSTPVTTTTTTDLSAVQASLALRNSAGVQTTFASVPSPVPGTNTAFAALPTGVASSVSLASGSAARLRIDGGGGGDLLDAGNPPADNSPAAPDAPATPAATPPAPMPQTPAPKKEAPMPEAPADVDAVFLQGESLPDLAEGQAPVGLPRLAAGLASRSEPSAAVLGLALALVLHRHGQPTQSAERERRRLRVWWRE
jgi:subtilase family serine protease